MRLVSLCVNRKPSGRLEAVQLMKVMDEMMDRAGVNQEYSELTGLSQVRLQANRGLDDSASVNYFFNGGNDCTNRARKCLFYETLNEDSLEFIQYQTLRRSSYCLTFVFGLICSS